VTVGRVQQQKFIKDEQRPTKWAAVGPAGRSSTCPSPAAVDRPGAWQSSWRVVHWRRRRKFQEQGDHSLHKTAAAPPARVHTAGAPATAERSWTARSTRPF